MRTKIGTFFLTLQANCDHLIYFYLCTGVSPGHPPIPKKPAITPKPAINKPPVVAQKKNGTGKSPVPKPKPRTPQKSAASRDGSPSVPPVPSRSSISHQKTKPEEEKTNGVAGDARSLSRDLSNSELKVETPSVEMKCDETQEKTAQEELVEDSNGKDAEDPIGNIQNGLLEDSSDVGGLPTSIPNNVNKDDKQPSSPIDIFKDDDPKLPPLADNFEDNSKQVPPLSPIDIFGEDKKKSTSPENIFKENKPSPLPARKLVKKQPPPLKPRTPNSNYPARRTKSAFVPGPPNTSESKTEVTATKSVDIFTNDTVIHPEQQASEDMPAIPVRRKRLSREVTNPVVFNMLNSKTESDQHSNCSQKAPTTPVNSPASSPGRPPQPNVRRKPLKECVSAAVDEESPPSITSRETPSIAEIEPPPLPVASKDAPLVAPKEILPTSPSVAQKETAPPPVVPRRTDTNGNPAKIRAKSEYIKKKPARPPPPAVKPTLSMALPSNGSTPPPKHPKPAVRKAKSQCLPSDTSLGFSSINIEDSATCSQDSDGPKIPPRLKRRSVEKVLDADESNLGSSADNFVLKKTVYDTQADSVMETQVAISTASDTMAAHPINSKPELSQVVTESSRKSLPSPLTKSKNLQPKLQRSMTEPESHSPTKHSRPHPKDVPSRKAPPIPVKPIHASPANNKFESDTDSSRSSCTSPEIPIQTPPLSPKSFTFKSQHSSSPKHRPRMPPPPPPPVERTNSAELPEPPRRITSRSKSLDATLACDSNSCDPNGNIPRTVISTVENENAKNSMKSDIFSNRDSQDSSTSSSAVQSTSDDKSMSSISRNSVLSEDDDYVLPDPDPQSPPLSPRKVPITNQDDQIYQNKQVASVRPSRRVAPPRPVKPVLPRKTSVPPTSPPLSPNATCPVSPSAFSRMPGSGKLKKKPPAKPVRRSLSINSDISNDGYEDMSKGSSLASSLGIGAQMADLYSVPR